MHTVSHLNIDVSFPYAPYKEQEKIMETVIKAAVLSQNCLIDSPTGTGKTLSLLLASIAWQTSNPGSKIYFTSRTHSQLSQAMQQLKKSSYKVKIASLASRDQLCSNNIKTSFQGQNLARNCRKLVDSKSCSHYNNLPTARADNAVNDIVDIEDLKLFGAKHNACPFYLSRDNQATADLIFLPYNYIVDINSRKSQNIILKDSIIIFDEAHNIESVCCDTKTVEFTTLDLDVAISQVKNSNVKDLTLQLTKLKTEIISLSFTDSSKLKGSIICEIFDKIFDSLRYQEIIDKIDALININQHSANSISKLVGVRDILVYVSNYPQDDQFWNSFKVAVKSVEKSSGVMLGLYCLSSGIVMNELINEGARSIILASGTLAPHDSFEAEMKISFPLKLENGHVIKNHQILFRSIHKGPSNVILNSKFSNKDNKAYLNEIGECLCTFAEHSEGGLLAFFPSYSLLDSCIKNWNSSTGLIKQISSFKKVFVEASDKYKFDSEIKGYSDQIRRDPVRGAIFLAVCRGKASEGVDFSGDLGRTVLIFGIPYASPKDSKVELKRLYLTENIKYGFDGNKWYNQQASRAVNQAIGRVIRHKDDYGSIFLMDERFNDSYKRFLPSWTRKYFEASSIYEIPQLLSNFYNKAKELLPIAPKEVIYNKKVVKVSKIVSKIDMSSSTTFSTVSTGMSSSTTMNSIPSLTTMERLNQIKLPPVAYMSPTKVRTKRDAFSPLVVKTVKKQVQKTTLNYTNSMKILVGDVSVIDKNSVFLDKVIMIFNDQQKNTFERIIFKHRRLFKEEFFTIFRKLFCGGEERIVKLKLDHLSHSNGTYEFIEELVLMMGLRGDTRPIWREMFFSLRKFLKAVERSEFEAYVSSSDQAFFCKFFKPDP